MRGRLIILTVLLASALTACGSDSQTPGKSQGVALGEGAATTTPVTSSSETTGTSGLAPDGAPAPKKVVPAVKASYVAPTAQLKIKALHGKSPAVVLLPDTGNGDAARTEAEKLAAIGVGSLVVESPAKPPTDVASFDVAVAQTLQAVQRLRKQEGVDPKRIGIVAEGVGAHVAAVALGRDPGTVIAATLADIGGTVVPSPAFAPEKWLAKTDGTQLLFQRDNARRAMTRDEIKRLMVAAPAGTLMEQYAQLGGAAQKSRDTWIKGKLLAG